MPLSTKLDKRNEEIKIYINGEFFHRDQAKISVFDSGFLLGDGIWEGIRLVNNSWLFLDEHLDRLYEGCKAIDIRLDEDKKFLTNAIIETQKINNITDAAHARVMVTRGNKIKPFQQPSLSKDGINLVIIMEHSEEHPNTDGVKLVTVPQVRGLPMSQDPKLNSHSKLNCIIACIQANKSGGDEALMLDPLGFVNTTNSCNFFIVKNGEVWTSTGDYCMNGITRLKVIEICKNNKIPIYEKNFSLVDVYSSQEAFITGTLGSLTQVTNVDDRLIGNVNHGWPVTEKLRKLYKDLIYAQ
ncbi:MAG: putative branched-chain-amino-acid aminotransferase [SAR86 cluster bacterium SAR86A]|jgi:branched-chain amino acid aminotransferase|uniref:Aminodeoxychorismate lyase n=1 Tax=SAR86 cluster bacterium SAR86A TaxID=1123866 RepID=J5KF19_9GAMM|nr:MAG: putative branched-chain-amino-acid aminotransferase [SAR86 cluster bacterium SAR86A]